VQSCFFEDIGESNEGIFAQKRIRLADHFGGIAFPSSRAGLFEYRSVGKKKNSLIFT